MKDYIRKFPDYTRYKIRHKKKLGQTGIINYIIDWGGKLYFQNFRYGKKDGKIIGYRETSKFILTKNSQYNLYIWNKGLIKNCSPSCDYWINSWRELKKTQNRRVNYRLKSFLRNHKDSFKIQIDDRWQHNILKIIYGLLRELPLENNFYIDSRISPFLRLPSWNDFFDECFGSHGKKTKQLFWKRFNKHTTFDIFHLLPFRNLVPIERIHDVLAYPEKNGFTIMRVREARSLLKKLNESQRIKCLLDKHISTYVWADTIRMFSQYPLEIPKFKDIHHLHNIFMRDAARLRTKEFEFNHPKNIELLHGVQLDDGLSIIIPQTNHELADWSNLMSNCVGSYAYEIKNKKIKVIGILQNNKLLYNISIRRGKLEQFLGPHNQNPEKEHYNNVVKFLENKEIISTN